MAHPVTASSTSSLFLIEHLQAVTEQLSAASTTGEVLGSVLVSLRETLADASGTLLLLGPSGEHLDVGPAGGEETGRRSVWTGGPLNHADPAGDALLRREALYFGRHAELVQTYPELAGRMNLTAPDVNLPVPSGNVPGASAALPLVLEGRGIGTLMVDFREPHSFAPEEKGFLRTLAALCAVALGRVRLGEELEARVAARTAELEAQSRSLQEERTALDAFVAYQEAVGDERDVQALARQAIQVLRASLPHVSAAYYELDGQLWKARAWSGELSDEMTRQIRCGVPLDAPDFAEATRSRAAVFADGWNAGPNSLSGSTLPGTPMSGAVALVPLLTGNELHSLLAVGTPQAHIWSERERAIVRAVTRGLALTLERSAAAAALDRTQHYLKVAAENAPILLFATDARGVFTLSEGRLLEQLGLRPGQAVGQLATALFAREPDLREGRRLAQALDGEIAHDLTHFESSGVSLESWFIPVKDSSGAVTEVVGVSLDVTERLETQRRIERANAELRRSNEELEQFAYVASHDLQEPLRTITSFSQLLITRYSGQLDPRAEVYVRQISEGTGRMAQLLQDLLAFARVTSGAGALVEVDMNTVLAQVVQDLHARTQQTGAAISVGDLPRVRGDASQLRQVFQNLIGNALKFRDPQRPSVIRVEAVPDGANVRFSVRDNGIGIEAEFFGRIFTIFQRLHGREEYEGNGIGLSITRKIAERHGGEVWLDSEPGAGSTFFLTLPAASDL
ncbi:ATP-binding protein [Deinococcus marmoris]|uniref:histidine kinase n=1 Tax=Deinococcus marmoris TaxID=249408 RepID=A0A1U7NXS3_9DEIO|nr:ATP-binding protein [Deinococcus marmoris]OLV17704.1 Phytochrome, two-component sensor histidine kinase [Deinococcus marmoris]